MLEERGLRLRRTWSAGWNGQPQMLVGGGGGRRDGPRRVRASSPRRMRNGSTTSSMVSGSSWDAHRDRLNTNRVTAERPAEHAEHAPVELVQTDRIDAEHVERGGRDVDVDAPRGAHLGVVHAHGEAAG